MKTLPGRDLDKYYIYKVIDNQAHNGLYSTYTSGRLMADTKKVLKPN